MLEEIDVGPYFQLCWSFEVLIVSPELFNSGDISHWVQTIFVPIFSFHELLVPESKRLVQQQRTGLRLLHNIQSKNYGVKRHIQLINTPMSRQPHPEKQPFLDKFQGKKNIISKEGLLHLLENRPQAGVNQKVSGQKNHKGPLQRLKPISYNELRDNIAPRTEPHSERKSIEQKGNKQSSYNADSRYGIKEELKSQQLINYTKLPAISKSISVSRDSRQRKVDVLNAEATGITGSSGLSGKNRLKSLSHQPYSLEHPVLNSINRKIELDSFAVRHLQFLDKFQKQLLHNDAISKRTSRSERN